MSIRLANIAMISAKRWLKAFVFKGPPLTAAVNSDPLETNNFNTDHTLHVVCSEKYVGIKK